jgi:hypothetical protein
MMSGLLLGELVGFVGFGGWEICELFLSPGILPFELTNVFPDRRRSNCMVTPQQSVA